jgi:hypothetical protein
MQKGIIKNLFIMQTTVNQAIGNTPKVYEILHDNCILGFDRLGQCVGAILSHDDFAQRWELNSLDDQRTLETWRNQTIQQLAMHHFARLRARNATPLRYVLQNDRILILYQLAQGAIWYGCGVLDDATGQLDSKSFTFDDSARNQEQICLFLRKAYN